MLVEKAIKTTAKIEIGTNTKFTKQKKSPEEEKGSLIYSLFSTRRITLLYSRPNFILLC